MVKMTLETLNLVKPLFHISVVLDAACKCLCVIKENSVPS